LLGVFAIVWHVCIGSLQKRRGHASARLILEMDSLPLALLGRRRPASNFNSAPSFLLAKQLGTVEPHDVAMV
jgi:hypothetical protein